MMRAKFGIIFIYALVLSHPVSADDKTSDCSKIAPACHPHATKVIDNNLERGYRCVCKQGFFGNGFYCSKPCSISNHIVCNNGKACILDADNKPKCECPQHTVFNSTTEKCQKNGNACTRCEHNCVKNAECEYVDGSSNLYNCKCKKLFVGNGLTQCDKVDANNYLSIVVDEKNRQSTHKSSSKHAKLYPPSYCTKMAQEGKAPVCVKPAEVISNVESSQMMNQTCECPHNSLGSGFEGDECFDRLCSDHIYCLQQASQRQKGINEKTSQYRAPSRCVYPVGSKEKTCVCMTGQRLVNGQCEDIDECKECKHNCNKDAYCMNMVTSSCQSHGFNCICTPGTFGQGDIENTCIDYDECANFDEFKEKYGTTPCEHLPHSECQNIFFVPSNAGLQNWYRCYCAKGFRGHQGSGVVNQIYDYNQKNDTECKPSCDTLPDIAFMNTCVCPCGGLNEAAKPNHPYPLGTELVVSCKNGYAPGHTGDKMKCTSPDKDTPGKWENVPTCVQTCTSIYDKNNEFDAAYSDPMRRESSNVTLTCKHNLKTLGNNVATCIKGEWVFPTGVYPTCQEPCNSAKLQEEIKAKGYNDSSMNCVRQGDKLANENLYLDGSHCSFNCPNKHYIMSKHGEKKSCATKKDRNVATCKANGSSSKWVFNEAADVLESCTAPCKCPVIANATYLPISDTIRCGDTLKMKCKNGYIMYYSDGKAPTTSSSSMIQCEGANKWTNLGDHSTNLCICKPGCSELKEVPHNLEITYPHPGNLSLPDDIAHLACPSNYTLVGPDTAKCMQTHGGYSWHLDPKSKCVHYCEMDQEVICGTVSYTDIISVGDKHKVVLEGSEAQLSCEIGKVPVGKTRINCIEGKWNDNFGKCTPTCTKDILIAHAKIDYKAESTGGNLSQGVVIEGSRASIQCESNYHHEGATHALCRNGVWVYLGKNDTPSSKTECHPTCQIFTVEHGKANVRGQKEDTKLVVQGDVVQIQCDDGYTLEGVPEVTCLDVNSYSYPPPTCAPGCKEVTIKNGHVVFDKEVINGLVLKNSKGQVECNPHYHLIGDCSIRCLGDDKWVHKQLPQCVAECGALEILHGNVAYKSDSGFRLQESSATIRCDNNYQLNGKKELTCEIGKSNPADNGKTHQAGWPMPLPTCDAVCRRPQKLTHGSVSGDGEFVSLNKAIDLTCDDGYILYGSKRLVCVDAGKFDLTMPECREGCHPFNIADGSVQYSGSTQTPKLLPLNATATIKCNAGFVNNGPNQLTCIATNQWNRYPDEARCRPVCDVNTITVVNGTLTSGNRYIDVGDSAVFECDSGLHPTNNGRIRCSAPGHFEPGAECVAWNKDIYPGSLYYVFPRPVTHQEAANLCDFYGGHLATIGSGTEMYRLVDHLRQLDIQDLQPFWLGTYQDNDEHLFNSDSSLASYSSSLLMGDGNTQHENKRAKRTALPEPFEPSNLNVKWVSPSKAPAHPTKATAHPTKATAHPTKATAHPTKATAHPSKATAHPTKATAHPTKATAHPTKATAHPTNATAHPTKATAPATEATAHPTKETVPETEAAAHPTKETSPATEATSPVEIPNALGVYVLSPTDATMKLRKNNEGEAFVVCERYTNRNYYNPAFNNHNGECVVW